MFSLSQEIKQSKSYIECTVNVERERERDDDEREVRKNSGYIYGVGRNGIKIKGQPLDASDKV